MYSPDIITSLEHGNNGQLVWIEAEQSLLWVDHSQKILQQFNTRTQEITQHNLLDPILSLTPSSKHGFIATLEDGIGFYDLKARKVVYISKPEPFSSNTIIGGVADNQGSYWSFTKPQGQDSTEGNLYHIDANMKTQRFSDEQLLCTAPPAFSRDGLTLYQSAGRSRYIYATSLDENKQPSSTRVFCRIPKAEGYPHGLSVDSEGNVWICHREVGLLSGFNSQGERIERIEFDAPGLDYCAFGGNKLNQLFILSSSVNKDSKNKTNVMANSLLRIELAYTGIQAEAF